MYSGNVHLTRIPQKHFLFWCFLHQMVVHVDTIEQLARKLCTVTFFHEFICPCTGIGLCVILTNTEMSGVIS